MTLSYLTVCSGIEAPTQAWHALGWRGVNKTAHGMRKTLATALADGGATTFQVASWTGHQSLSEVQHYTKSAERKRAVMG